MPRSSFRTALRAGAATPELAERRRQVGLPVHLEPDRMVDALVRKHLAAAGLRPEGAEAGVGAVGGETEPNRELDLGLRHREGDHQRELRVSDQAPDPLDRPGRFNSLDASGSFLPSTSETVTKRERASGVSSSGTRPK